MDHLCVLLMPRGGSYAETLTGDRLRGRLGRLIVLPQPEHAAASTETHQQRQRCRNPSLKTTAPQVVTDSRCWADLGSGAA